jgi:hypothetical protein
MFTFSIDIDNAAFDDDHRAELVRLLDSWALSQPALHLTKRHKGCDEILDVNGNTVGSWTYAPKD